MRVIAGTARSMPLRTVRGQDVRPTTDRTKETLFNILQFRIPGCRFLDLYAGSGSIGIEALSRGAAGAYFVEKDRKTQQLILENLEFTRLAERATLLKGDVQSVLPSLEKEDPFDIIFMDPPFDHGLERQTLTLDFSYVEDLGYRVIRHKIYGQSTHLFLERAGDTV